MDFNTRVKLAVYGHFAATGQAPRLADIADELKCTSTMPFFRSEEMIAAWCLDRGIAPRPLVTVSQLWELAVAWYASRLSPDARRPGPAEMRRIFARIGLEDPFWDPESDVFG